MDAHVDEKFLDLDPVFYQRFNFRWYILPVLILPNSIFVVFLYYFGNFIKDKYPSNIDPNLYGRLFSNSNNTNNISSNQISKCINNQIQSIIANPTYHRIIISECNESYNQLLTKTLMDPTIMHIKLNKKNKTITIPHEISHLIISYIIEETENVIQNNRMNKYKIQPLSPT